MEVKSIIERDDNRRKRDKCNYLFHYENGELPRSQRPLKGGLMLAEW